ncbi:MAG: citrate lyase holo-[acyl-carrier protein] synthase [Lepagella sp.]
MESHGVCTLMDMLRSRDRRQERQEHHFRATPGATLLVATVVAPGEYKLTPDTAIVAEAMIASIREKYEGEILSLEHQEYVSGHEVWVTLSIEEMEAKRRAVEIEEEHLLGRLFDIDVILPEIRPISRQEIGMPQRRCIICDNEARLCMRMKLHTPGEIQEHIKALIRRYLDTTHQ